MNKTPSPFAFEELTAKGEDRYGTKYYIMKYYSEDSSVIETQQVFIQCCQQVLGTVAKQHVTKPVLPQVN